jgi:hypothetical protein
MRADQPKSWWQTFPGLLTAVAATITAIAGLLAVFMQLGWIGRGSTVPAVQAENRAAESASQHRTVPGTAEQRTSGSERPIERVSREIPPPAKREYDLGPGLAKGTFMILGASLSPRTPESDLLTIRWRYMSRSDYRKSYGSHWFKLLVQYTRIEPEHYFRHEIPPRESREGDLSFVIPAATTRAVLRIDDFAANIEIPFELVSSATADARDSG